jgi:multidrug efflux system membrane fusion protein
VDQIVGKRADLQDPPNPVRPRGRFPWVTVLVILLLAGGGAWYWQHRPVAAPAPAARGEQAQAVGVAPVVKGDIPVVYDGLGTVTSLATVTVKTQINGQLTQIAFTEGQIVKKGDFLAQIDPRPYQVALEEAQGALARDEASLHDAQIDLARYQKLNQQDSIAHQQVDTQQALVHQDEGTIQTDQASIDSAKLNLVYCHIVSPVDGRVGLRQVDAGNYVQTSDTSGIVVITQLQPISVIFTQPEDRLPAITKRLRDGATLDVSIFDRAGKTRIADGSVATLDNQIDTTTGTVKLRALFPNADDALFPNQFVNVRLLLDTMKDATVVPTAAIQIGAPGPFVYVVKDDDTVTVRQLKLGPAAGERTAVLDGLSPGERVVTDGVDRLREGAKVRIPAAGGKGALAGDGGAAPAARSATGAQRGASIPADAASPGAPDADKQPSEPAQGGKHHHRRQDQAPAQDGGAP